MKAEGAGVPLGCRMRDGPSEKVVQVGLRSEALGDSVSKFQDANVVAVHRFNR